MEVNKVELANGEVLIDLTGDTVTEDNLLEGFTAHAADGSQITGTYVTPQNGDVYNATYGTTSFADIKSAYDDGKYVICNYGGSELYQLSEIANSACEFSSVKSGQGNHQVVSTITCGSLFGWSPPMRTTIGESTAADITLAPIEGMSADNVQEAMEGLYTDTSERIRKIYAQKTNDYLSDSDDGKIKNLKLYGKTTQDGAATPSSPVALHSIEEINVRVTKKNMLPSPTFSGSTYGVVWECGIPCKANETVTFSFKVDSVPVNDKRGQLVASTDSHIENRFNPVTGEINMTTIQIAAGTNTATLTPQADGYVYFRIVERSSSWSLYDMQLEHGETATAYEAYSEQARTITPPAPLHGLGTYRDVCDVDAGVWKYNIGSRLVSDRSWLERGSGTDYYTQYGISGFLKKGNTPAISTCFGTGASWGGNNANKVGIGNGDQSYCFIGKSTFPTLADCNAFMQAHDVYVYSALETPTETAIDSADLEFLRSLSSAYPQTNVFVTDQDNRSIDSDFLYPMSIKTTLESMRKDIDRLLTLIVNT